jgi:hypothetical protein
MLNIKPPEYINLSIPGTLIAKRVIFTDHNDSFIQSRVPWSTEPSLKDMAREAGVNYDRLINGIKEDKSDSELAGELAVSEKLIYHLRDRFYTHGIHSIMGQD